MPAFYVVTGDKVIVDACRAYPLDVIDPEAPGALSYLRSLRRPLLPLEYVLTPDDLVTPPGLAAVQR